MDRKMKSLHCGAFAPFTWALVFVVIVIVGLQWNKLEQLFCVRERDIGTGLDESVKLAEFAFFVGFGHQRVFDDQMLGQQMGVVGVDFVDGGVWGHGFESASEGLGKASIVELQAEERLGQVLVQSLGREVVEKAEEFEMVQERRETSEVLVVEDEGGGRNEGNAVVSCTLDFQLL